MSVMNNDIYYSPNSMFDGFGRVFFYNGKVYRAISKDAVKECLDLLNHPFFKELMDSSLIPKTIISDLSLPDFELILEHEKLLNIHQNEWSFSMFKDAALMILKVQSICEKYGYELKDAHTLNVLFKGSKPMYVDIGSFQKKEGDHWVAHEEFINSFYIPLCFWSEGKFYITRKILENKFYRMQTIPDQKFCDSGLFDLLNAKPFRYEVLFRGKVVYTTQNQKSARRLSNFLNKTASLLKGRSARVSSSPIIFDDRSTIIRKIESMDFPESVSLWKGYHSKFYEKEGQVELSDRLKNILGIIEKINAEDPLQSTLDLAGNEGLMSFLIKDRFNIPSVTLSDYDENAIEVACRYRKEHNLDINILLLNFMFPPSIEDVSKRIKSDLVMALAVTHHLVLTSKFVLSTIFERVRSYSNKYVLIEFMPKGLWSIEHREEVDVPYFYTLDWFKDEFSKYFDILQIETLEENRILFVGKIKG